MALTDFLELLLLSFDFMLDFDFLEGESES